MPRVWGELSGSGIQEFWGPRRRRVNQGADTCISQMAAVTKHTGMGAWKAEARLVVLEATFTVCSCGKESNEALPLLIRLQG